MQGLHIPEQTLPIHQDPKTESIPCLHWNQISKQTLPTFEPRTLALAPLVFEPRISRCVLVHIRSSELTQPESEPSTQSSLCLNQDPRALSRHSPHGRHQWKANAPAPSLSLSITLLPSVRGPGGPCPDPTIVRIREQDQRPWPPSSPQLVEINAETPEEKGRCGKLRSAPKCELDSAGTRTLQTNRSEAAWPTAHAPHAAFQDSVSPSVH